MIYLITTGSTPHTDDLILDNYATNEQEIIGIITAYIADRFGRDRVPRKTHVSVNLADLTADYYDGYDGYIMSFTIFAIPRINLTT